MLFFSPYFFSITREAYYDLMDKMEGLTVPMELTPFKQ